LTKTGILGYYYPPKSIPSFPPISARHSTPLPTERVRLANHGFDEPVETLRFIIIPHMLTLVSIPERDTRIEGNFVRDAIMYGVLVCFCLAGGGCASVFSKPVMSAAPQSLAWFSNFAASPVEMSQPFDLTLIQPTTVSGISPNDMLEITIWDLFEPGKPHTFPSRVDSAGKINVPHLASISVAGFTAADVETQLIESYRQSDVLKQPRVLVRELPSAPLHVYVTGAVQRPGMINLPRRNASVFSALVSAGGLSRQSGTHVFVSDQTTSKTVEPNQSVTTESTVTPELPLVAGNSGIELSPEATRPDNPESSRRKARTAKSSEQAIRFQSEPPPQSLTDLDLPEQPEGGQADVNLSDQLAKDPPFPVDAAAGSSDLEESIATRPLRGSAGAPPTRAGRWYDLTSDRDRDQLKQLVLREGDVITVRAAALPVRITGAVTQPGPYRTPAGNAFTINEAVELAGGLSIRDKPVTVILTRPASRDRGLQRWTFRLGDGQPLPPNAPNVQAGDVIHVEPTAKARVQGVVDAFRPSKW